MSGSRTEKLLMTPGRFRAKVNKNGPVPAHRPELGQCWIWTGAKKPGKWAYGLVSYRHERTSAHRIAWKLANGPIPDGLFVLHKCDNPPCCNPAHLFVGTAQDNAQDMVSKGRGRYRVYYGDDHHSHKHPERMARGERVNTAKLTAADVVAIRYALSQGETRAALARRYSVTPTNISDIKNREIWRHVP